MANLNSKFAVSAANEYGADSLIFLESRGGRKTGPGARNPDYAKQLDRILRALKKHDCVIVRIEVVSKVAYQRGATRRLSLKFPIRMSEVESIDQVRKDIQAAQRSLVQRPGASGGNTTKRIGIWIKVGPLVPALGLKHLLSSDFSS
jgi:hypothetical protein